MLFDSVIGYCKHHTHQRPLPLKGSETSQFRICAQNLIDYKSSVYLNIPRDNPYEMVAEHIWHAYKTKGKVICIAKVHLQLVAERLVLLLQSHGIPAAFIDANHAENNFLEDGDVLILFKDSKAGKGLEGLVKKLKKLDKDFLLIVFTNEVSPFLQKNCDQVLSTQTASVLQYDWMYEAELELFNSLITITELALKTHIEQENSKQATATSTQRSAAPSSPSAPTAQYDFTGREMRILRLFLQGKPRKEIAQSLGLSCSGIDYITRIIGNKLGVRGIRAVLAKAMELGLLRSPGKN
jgi:DNA-binding NarL/FixJ family response regulator